MKSPGKKAEAGSPVVRLRYTGMVVGLVALMVSWPLFSVWRQVFTHDMYIRKEVLTDSLRTQGGEIAQLRILSRKFSANERVEQFARYHLAMDYPSPEQIVIVSAPGKKQPVKSTHEWEFFAVLRRSLERERG